MAPIAAQPSPALRVPVRRGRLTGFGGKDAARTVEDRELIRRCQQDTDPRVFEATLEAFMPLARSLARRYHRGEEPLDDLEQVAALGLMKAMRGFDPDRGKSFAGYAVPTIAGELRRHFRDKGWGIHVPRGLQELAVAVHRDSEVLSTALGRAPTAKEVAAKAGRTEEEVVEAREAFRAMRPASLNRTAAAGDDEDDELLARIGGVDPGYERAEESATLGPLMDRLPDRERQLLALRFDADLTQSEIGERMGISQMHVSRLLRRTLDGLEQRSAAA